MRKRVVVIASGATERVSLPHLLRHLQAEGIELVEVRQPNRNKNLTPEMAEKLITASWWASQARDWTPDKFVVLLDADGKPRDEVLRPFCEQLPRRLAAKIRASLQFACAQWHLEAWYFADAAGLRACLGRDAGDVDASKPDEIQSPKNHLKNLLGDRVYTAVVAEAIARALNAETIANHSPSFRDFVGAVRNGEAKTG